MLGIFVNYPRDEDLHGNFKFFTKYSKNLATVLRSVNSRRRGKHNCNKVPQINERKTEPEFLNFQGPQA
jgi:hypothetical protein